MNDKKKTAKYTLKIVDKGGYRSTESGMMSADQYGRICKILQEKESQITNEKLPKVDPKRIITDI